MADLSKIVRRYEIQSDTSGLDKIAAAADKAAASTSKLSTATTSLASSTDKTEKSILAVSSTLDRMAKAADPAIAAAARLEVYQQKLNAAAKLGQPMTATQAAGLAALQKRVQELTKSTEDHTKATGLNRVQLLEATHVAKSFADSLVAGASPLRALSLEGGRIAQIFAEGSGGVGGTLKAMGGTVARLATGWLGLGAAVAAGAGLAVAAIYRFQGQQDRLALSLNGAGRFTGVSLGGLTGIANAAGARNPFLGQGGATNLAATLASTGRISAGIMPGILDLATPYARGTGQDLTKAGDELAKAFANPGKGAEELNSKLGFLDDKTKQLIGSFERQGDLLGAQQVLLSKAADAASQMADRTWTIAKAWGAIGNAVSGTFNAIGSGIERAVNGPTTQDSLSAAYAEQERRRGRSFGFGLGFSSFDTSNGAGLQNRILGLNYSLYGQTRGESDSATRAASDKATNDLSILVGEAIRKAVPELDKSQELSDTLKLLTDALNNPDVVSKTKGGASAILEARSRAQGALDYANPVTRTQIEGGLSAAAAQAQTGVERTAIEARRAEIEVIAAGGSTALAPAKSIEIWNDAIAKSNKEAEDALRGANQRAGLIGLSPLQRAVRENQYRYDDLRRNSVTGAPGLSALSPDDLRMTALDPDATKALKRAFGNSAPSSDALDAAHDLTGGLVATSKSAIAGIPSFPARAPRIGAYSPAAVRFAPGNINVASTASGSLGQAQSVDKSAILDEYTTERIRRSSEELQRNKQLLDARTRSIGLSNDAILKAVHVQEDWNELQLTDNDKELLGTQRVKQLGDQIDVLATKQTAYDKQQQQYDQLASGSNWFQQTGNSVVRDLGSSFGDLFNANPRNLVSQLKVGDQAKYYGGQLSGSAVKQKIFMMQAGNFLRNLMFQQGVGMIQKGLFGSGQYGSPGYQSGLLGGAFNGLLGGIGGGMADFSIGDGASLSNDFNNFAFADGGVMTSRGPLPLRRYAGGGVASSPQVAIYGEGKTPEAYVPLPDGRRIPVAMSGAHAPTINMGGHTIVIQGNADSDTATLIDQKLAAANKQMMTDLQRNLGQMQAKWQQRNGS